MHYTEQRLTKEFFTGTLHTDECKGWYNNIRYVIRAPETENLKAMCGPLNLFLKISFCRNAVKDECYHMEGILFQSKVLEELLISAKRGRKDLRNRLATSSNALY